MYLQMFLTCGPNIAVRHNCTYCRAIIAWKLILKKNFALLKRTCFKMITLEKDDNIFSLFCVALVEKTFFSIEKAELNLNGAGQQKQLQREDI